MCIFVIDLDFLCVQGFLSLRRKQFLWVQGDDWTWNLSQASRRSFWEVWDREFKNSCRVSKRIFKAEGWLPVGNFFKVFKALARNFEQILWKLLWKLPKLHKSSQNLKLSEMFTALKILQFTVEYKRFETQLTLKACQINLCHPFKSSDVTAVHTLSETIQFTSRESP